MKTSLINSQELIIKANMNKDGDYETAEAIAEAIVANYPSDLVICSADEDEGWLHITATADTFTADEMKYFYQQAKKSVK